MGMFDSGGVSGSGLVHGAEALGGVFQAGLVRIDDRGDAGQFPLPFQALKTLPLGTSYAIWTGIGALGSVAVGILVFQEPATAARMFFAALLLTGIVGLKLTSAG